MGIFKAQRWPLWLTLSLILVSILGFIDAGYLTVKHFKNELPVCDIYQGCEVVATSIYSEIAGIPVALLGVAYYLLIFIFTLVYFDTEAKWIKKFLPYITIIGFMVSLYLVYLQLMVIIAVCLYCMASAVTSTIIFILGMVALKYNK